MYATWLHAPPSTLTGEKPLCWWRQMQERSFTELPFAHLFPRPPARARRRRGEAAMLVADLVFSPSRPRSIAEELGWVLGLPPGGAAPRRQAVPTSPPEEIQAAEHDASLWGEDGTMILAWFEAGDQLCESIQAKSEVYDA